ncbi:uncharacterized protein BDR25DRAFT_349896 [Lindgomyces ingoldianus]|uniref:Uncharacterized protein n=1 Tax=Lindgomyces ingoldianus TaxID=673940 RepID=A0ACB6R8N6_9PLEO|nr:uncharacterized protein BDR25DRAFT_349896 [Lindgomyces ingoldianus]KAF2475614.1 hypothetical protein BDR25DRAFT_349896 [Lindgomyces ingoldianus]
MISHLSLSVVGDLLAVTEGLKEEGRGKREGGRESRVYSPSYNLAERLVREEDDEKVGRVEEDQDYIPASDRHGIVDSTDSTESKPRLSGFMLMYEAQVIWPPNRSGEAILARSRTSGLTIIV